MYAYHTFLARLKLWRSIELESEAKVLADRVRQNTKIYRTIIIAGHSEGGILGQAAVCELIDRDDRDTLAAIKGLLLFVTPEAGSLRVPWLLRWQKDARVLRPHSPLQRKIQQTFTERVVGDAEQARPGQFVIPTYAVVAAEDIWVDEFSSSLRIPRERINNVRASHTTVVKPRDKEDDTYLWIYEKLQAIVETAPDVATAAGVEGSLLPASWNPETTKICIPNNLPRLQPFFGRTEELKRIKDAIDPSFPTASVLIHGPGGRGKTSLALRAAYGCPPGQFERIIFVSVKDREMNDDGEQRLRGVILRGALQVLNEITRELGQPEITKTHEERRIRVLLEVLRTARVLLVLDNLESLSKRDRDQLLTFVNNLPQGCKAILTGRRRIGSGYALPMLERLTEDASLELIADLAKQNPLLAKTGKAERVALVTQIDGNPLLLRWTAGQLGRGSCRTITEALLFLRTCPPKNDPLEFIFGDLAQEFTRDETKILCALTHFGLPARVEHAAQATCLNEELVGTGLRTFANRSLVVPDRDEATYTIVPIVAEFLRKRSPAVIAETANKLQQRVYRLIIENGGSKRDGMRVLETAWPAVAAALPLFIAGPNDQLQAICDAIYPFLNFSGRWDELGVLNEKAEAKALAADDKEHAGWRAYHGGLVRHRRGEADRVMEFSIRAAEHWKDAPATSSGPGLAAHLRGLGYKLKGNYNAAIDSHEAALDHARRISPDSRQVAISLADLADAALSSGDSDVAERDLRDALRISKAIGDDQVIAGCMTRLARVVLHKTDCFAAESLAREALTASEELGRKEFIADNCHVLAKCLVAQGKIAEALPYARKAVEIYEPLDSPKLPNARETLRECGE